MINDNEYSSLDELIEAQKQTYRKPPLSEHLLLLGKIALWTLAFMLVAYLTHRKPTPAPAPTPEPIENHDKHHQQ